MTDDNRRRALRFRSWHRGTREMDLLMGSFADAQLDGFTPAQLDRYEQILNLSDPDVYDWVAGVKPVPAEQDDTVMRLLCAHHYARKQD